jgi:xylose dehydrogenase (NAD/NADP)
MKMEQVGWGIIGSAGIADKRTIPEGIMPSDSSKLVALMGPHEGKLRAMAEKYGISKCYTEEGDILADPEVDAVYIATPNNLHHSQSIAAAEAGKHVLCEKPFAMNVRECDEIISACRKNGVKLAVGRPGKDDRGPGPVRLLVSRYARGLEAGSGPERGREPI